VARDAEGRAKAWRSGLLLDTSVNSFHGVKHQDGTTISCAYLLVPYNPDVVLAKMREPSPPSQWIQVRSGVVRKMQM
jgi:hypothetical protein